MKEFTNRDAKWAKEKVDVVLKIAEMLCEWEWTMHGHYNENRAKEAIQRMMVSSPRIATLMLEIKVNAKKEKNGN